MFLKNHAAITFPWTAWTPLNTKFTDRNSNSLPKHLTLKRCAFAEANEYAKRVYMVVRHADESLALFVELEVAADELVVLALDEISRVTRRPVAALEVICAKHQRFICEFHRDLVLKQKSKLIRSLLKNKQTSKISVAFGGILGGAPAAPYP